MTTEHSFHPEGRTTQHPLPTPRPFCPVPCFSLCYHLHYINPSSKSASFAPSHISRISPKTSFAFGLERSIIMRHDLQSFRNTLLGLIGDALDFAERSRVDAASLRPNQRHSIYVAIDRLREARRGAESIVVGTSRPSSLSSTSINLRTFSSTISVICTPGGRC